MVSALEIIMFTMPLQIDAAQNSNISWASSRKNEREKALGIQ
jgi:hypothetical protein